MFHRIRVYHSNVIDDSITLDHRGLNEIPFLYLDVDQIEMKYG
jgi:hypothetical protein